MPLISQGGLGTKPGQFKNYFPEMYSGSEAGSYVRLIEFVSFNSRLESNKERKKRLVIARCKPCLPAVLASTNSL